MADETSSIAIQLNVHLRGLPSMTKLNTELMKLKTNLQSIQRGSTGNGGLSRVAREAKDAADALTKVANASKRVNDAANRRTSVRNIDGERATQHTRASRSIMNEMQRQSRLHESTHRRRIAHLQREKRAQDQLAQSMTTLTGRLRVFEEMNDAIFRAGFRIQMLGNDMEAVGRQMLRSIVDVAQEFGNFEFMVNRAAGATGILQTATEGGVNIYDRFTERIQSLAQELRLFKPEEVAKATYFWASTSGQQVETLGDLEVALKAVNPLMKIAAMTETSYETAIKGVFAILTQYGLGLDKVQEITEKLHMTTQRTAAEFPDLVNSFKMVGPVAKEFGVTFDDMVVLFGRMADAGIRGTMTGRAFRQFFIQLARPAPKAKKVLDELWASSERFGNKSYLETVFPEGRFIGVNKYVEELAKRLQNATQDQRMFTLASITTANELPVLTALVSKQIEEIRGLGGGWDKSKEQMQDAAQGFAHSWEILRTSWNGTVGALQRGVEIIRIRVGKKIAEVFTPVIERITKALIDVQNWFAAEENQDVVEFFVKLAGAAAGILTVGGALTVLLGVLISLAAATRVVWGAFSPLLGVLAKAGGIIGVFVVAAVRNFEYLKGIVVTAFEEVQAALESTGASVKDVSDIFSGFAAIMAPVLDTAIWLFGQLILVVARLTAIIVKNESAMGILTAAAQLLGGVIAARLIFGIGKAVLGFNALAAAARTVAPALAKAAVTIRALDVATTVHGGGIRGLGSALKGLLPALGPGGWLVAGLAAVGIAFGVLYNNSSKFKSSVDNMVFEWITSMDELIAKTREVYEALGEFGPEAKRALSLDPVYQQMEREIADLRRLTASAGADSFIDIAERQNLHKLQVLEKQLEQYTSDTYQTYADAVQQLRDHFGSTVSLEEYMSQLRLEANRLGVEIDNVQAKSLTWDFFRNMAEDAKYADEQAANFLRQWDAMKAHPGGPQGPSPDAKARVLAQLGDLQAKGNLSPQVASAIQQALTDGTQQGIVAWQEEPTGEMDAGAEVEKTFETLSAEFVTAARGTLDANKILKEAMRTPTRGQQAKAIIGAFLKGPIADGFRTAKGVLKPGAALLARDWMQDTRDAFTTQLAGYEAISPKTADSFAIKYAESLSGALENLGENVTPTMRHELAELFRTVYDAAGVPVPQEVLDKIYGKGRVSAEAFNSGVKSPESQTNATDAGDTIADSAADGMKPGPEPYNYGQETTKDYRSGLASYARPVKTTADAIGKSTLNIGKYKDDTYTWGSHMTSDFARGLRANIEAIKDASLFAAEAAAGPLRHSTPAFGPLSGDDQWGYHLGLNLAEGMARSRGQVMRAALDLARAASMANSVSEGFGENAGITATSESNRTIKVQVEVTSPDGSVDRLKAAELERALTTNDLILSLEHMSVVG